MSSKNPTIRRILKEAAELNSSPSPDYHAAPLESDLFEWHFTLRGPPAPSSYEGGLYHGRIVLPPAYPLKPPSFRFTTPTGRFEVNREICLSISGHHEETWQPAWGIRTALTAIRSFMDSSASGQVGGMDTSEASRRRMAAQSGAFTCGICKRSNEAILKEHDETVNATGRDSPKNQDTVPKELRLAYREELKTDAQSSATSKALQSSEPAQPAQVITDASGNARTPGPAATPVQAQRIPAPVEQVPGWIDKAIYTVIGILIALLWLRYCV